MKIPDGEGFYSPISTLILLNFRDLRETSSGKQTGKSIGFNFKTRQLEQAVNLSH